MSGEQVTQPTEQVTQPALSQPQVNQPQVEPKPEPKPDLLTRVSQFKRSELTTIDPKSDGVDFDFKELESIQDPAQKELMFKAYKSMQSGWNKKYQSLSEQRKEVEKKLSDYSNWDTDKVNRLLNDPTFIKAAQQVAASKAPSTYQGTTEEWSSLSEGEKAKFRQMEQELNQLKQLNLQTETKRQDEQLKQKYGNYAPDVVDTTLSNLMSGKQQATREDIWKVIDYEDGVKRAYELGR